MGHPLRLLVFVWCIWPPWRLQQGATEVRQRDQNDNGKVRPIATSSIRKLPVGLFKCLSCGFMYCFVHDHIKPEQLEDGLALYREAKVSY